MPSLSSPSGQACATEGRRYVGRIGLHHFAHLRAVADGLDVAECAARYLGPEHGHKARTAHQQTIDAVQAVARRRGEPWPLVGLSIKRTDTSQPSLEEFADWRFDGFSEAEVLEIYQKTFPADCKAVRSQRLRTRQLALLHRLEAMAAEQPQDSDLVKGWFDALTAYKLTAAGIISLGELNARIATGGRWYRTLPAVVKAKAHRIAQHLAALLPAAPRPVRPVFAQVPVPSPALTSLPGFLISCSASGLRTVHPGWQAAPARRVQRRGCRAGLDFCARRLHGHSQGLPA